MKAMTFDGTDLKVEETKKDSYHYIRETVGGYIEHVPLASLGNIDLWCNEEGKLMDLEPTIALMHDGKVYDIVCGKVCFLRHDSLGNTRSLKDKDIEFLQNKFKEDGIAITKFGFPIQILKY